MYAVQFSDSDLDFVQALKEGGVEAILFCLIFNLHTLKMISLSF